MKSQEKVTVSVGDPEVRKQYGGLQQYYLYWVKGQDSKGQISTQRRYSDFDLVRGIMVRRWPGCFIPSLPSKVKLTQSDEQFLEHRGTHLQQFLRDVSKRDYLWNSDEMQLFLRTNNMECQKVLSSMGKPVNDELIYRLTQKFGSLSRPPDRDIELEINEFSKYINGLASRVQELRDRSEELNSSQAKFQKKCSKFMASVLSKYEDKFIRYYRKDDMGTQFEAIFKDPDNVSKKEQLEESLKEVPMKILFEELRRERRELWACQECLKVRQDYISQREKIRERKKKHQVRIDEVRNGEQSFISKIRKISSDESIEKHEKSVQKYNKQLESIQKLCDLINRHIALVEMGDFKRERTAAYYIMVERIATEELNIIEKEKSFWEAVLEHRKAIGVAEEKEEKARRQREEEEGLRKMQLDDDEDDDGCAIAPMEQEEEEQKSQVKVKENEPQTEAKVQNKDQKQLGKKEQEPSKALKEEKAEDEPISKQTQQTPNKPQNQSRKSSQSQSDHKSDHKSDVKSEGPSSPVSPRSPEINSPPEQQNDH